jgi:hypothetical protein
MHETVNIKLLVLVWLHSAWISVPLVSVASFVVIMELVLLHVGDVSHFKHLPKYCMVQVM